MPTSPDLEPASEGEHTPTPWRIDAFRDGPRYAHMDPAWKAAQRRYESRMVRSSRYGPIASTELSRRPEADAAHIVACVNGWDDLTAEITRLRSVVEEQAARVAELEAEVSAVRRDWERSLAGARHEAGLVCRDLDKAIAERDTLRTQNAALVEALETILRTERLTIRGARNIAREALEARAALSLAGKGR